MGDPLPSMSFSARAFNAFVSPGALGEELAERPKWLVTLILGSLLSTVSVGLLWWSPAGQRLMREEFRKQALKQGTTGQLEMMEKMIPIMAAASTALSPPMTAVVLALGAGVLWLAFTVVMAAPLRYPHYLAISAHAYFIPLVGGLIASSIMLARGSMRSTLSLAAFVPGVSMESPVYMVLATFDFFALWWIVATGVMVGRAGRLSPWKPTATLLGIYFAIMGTVTGIRIALL